MKLVHQIIVWLRERDHLTPDDLAYLEAEGFLRDGKPEYWEPWDDENWDDGEWEYQYLYEFDEEEEDRREVVARRRALRSRFGEQGKSRSGGSSRRKAREIAALLEAERPAWKEVLSPLRALAERLCPGIEGDSVPHLLRQAGDAELEEGIVELAAQSSEWYGELWRALCFEGYRQFTSGGDGGRAYAVAMRGGDIAALGCHAWALREPEIAWVFGLVNAQQHLMATCGRCWRERPEIAHVHLGRHPRSPAFWPHVVLYASQRSQREHRWPLSIGYGEIGVTRAELPETPVLSRAFAAALAMDRRTTGALLAAWEQRESERGRVPGVFALGADCLVFPFEWKGMNG